MILQHYLEVLSIAAISMMKVLFVLLATPARPSKRGRPDDAWEHAMPLDEAGETTRCKYCGFVSKCGGIARLKAHLSGGDRMMEVECCPNVSPEIRNLMTGVKKKNRKNPKGVLPKTSEDVLQGKALLQVKTIYFDSDKIYGLVFSSMSRGIELNMHTH